MKKQSGLRLTIIAIVCGILAAALTIFYLKQIELKYRKASQPVQQVKVSVVVPKTDLKKGSVITAKSVAARDVPTVFLPSNVIMAKDFKKLINRTLLMPLQKGRPITWEAVTGKSAKTFSENIELGRRAKSVKVNKVDSFDGLLRPGDHIDLMGNFTMSALGLDAVATSTTQAAPDDIIMPILENVEVLAAGKEDLNGRKYEYSNTKKSVDGFNMEFTIISLNLTAKQIARVELADGFGDMFAVLRHPKDTSDVGFDYVGVELLFEKDEPEKIDLVLDANGKPIGRIVGDNIIDENGNIIGKVVNGKAVTFDGKPMGKIVKGISADDPILNVAEIVDVVRDENGNIIGKIVNGQIIDENGNVIGNVDENGNAVSLTGEILGSIDKGVALDVNGNEISLALSDAVTQQASHTEQVVRDENGNIIGKVVNGQVLDENGNVIGTVSEDGQVIGLDGQILGVVETVLVDSDGNVTATETKVVRDKNGKIIGKVVNGQVIDENGNVIGTVSEDGQVTGLDGQTLGVVETVLVDSQGNIMAKEELVVRDANGKIIGKVVNGQVIDENGNVIGTVSENGKVVGLNGQVIGVVDTVLVDSEGNALSKEIQVVRDANGKIIGKIVNGQVIDANGKVIGKIDKDGNAVSLTGKVLGKIDTAVLTANGDIIDAADTGENENSSNPYLADYIDFISGGTGKDGITPVIKVRKQ